MASILDEILEWSTSRPLWQQDALRRLAMSGQVDDDAIAVYASACAGETAPLLSKASTLRTFASMGAGTRPSR